MSGEYRMILTVREAAERLGLSRNGTYEAIRRGELPALRIGRRVLVPLAALERMLEQAGLPGSSRSGTVIGQGN